MILFDLPVYQFVMNIFSITNPTLTIMKLITTLGSTLVLVCGILCIAILFKNKKYFKVFFVANLIGIAINRLLKIIIHRDRPSETLPLTYESSYSFPSGHSMMAMIFYGLIIYYVYKNVNKKWIRNLIICLLCFIIVAVGLSRIYLGVHYATDVVGGYLIGLVYLIIFLKLLKKFENRGLQKSHKRN